MRTNGARTAWMVTFLVTAWGFNWPLSKMALAFTPPILFSGMRTLAGGIILLIVARITRPGQLNLRKTWYIYLISSLFNIILYYALQTIGLAYLPSGLFSAIVFLQPMLVGILSWLWLGDPMHAWKVAGLVLGFVGVGVISLGSLSGVHSSSIGIVLAVATSVSWAIGTVYVKKTSSLVDPVWLVAIQLVIGGMLMSGIGSAIEPLQSIRWTGEFIALFAIISVIVIALGWLVYFTLIGSGEATKVASYTFLIPLISAFASALLMREPLTLSLVGGLVLVLVSIYLVNRPAPAVKEKASMQ
ncbi:DMT family transporter [Alicyclobacillus hesperidum]|uniref:DMT family transporter n=1 Tax=Alicyclobacillus hesperidum TaxID=89784 RepID=UPI0002F10762|nr:DMT family transporter [Alicyclobacillus hesperidum]